jgi:uncharacterized 2Fe-2S/4Fe-4S cluster protein (DUF4445 family)
VEDLVVRIEKIETATEPRFQEHFVSALGIPHKTAPYPHLSRVVTLPERTGSAQRRRRRRSSDE